MLHPITMLDQRSVDTLRERHILDALRRSRAPLTCTDLCIRIGHETLTARQIDQGRTICQETYKPALARLVLRGNITSALITRDTGHGPARRCIVYALAATPPPGSEGNDAR